MYNFPTYAWGVYIYMKLYCMYTCILLKKIVVFITDLILMLLNYTENLSRLEARWDELWWGLFISEIHVEINGDCFVQLLIAIILCVFLFAEINTF